MTKTSGTCERLPVMLTVLGEVSTSIRRIHSKTGICSLSVSCLLIGIDFFLEEACTCC